MVGLPECGNISASGKGESPGKKKKERGETGGGRGSEEEGEKKGKERQAKKVHKEKECARLKEKGLEQTKKSRCFKFS